MEMMTAPIAWKSAAEMRLKRYEPVDSTRTVQIGMGNQLST